MRNEGGSVVPQHIPAKAAEAYPYPEEEAPARRGSCLWALVGAGGCLVLPVIVLALLVLLGQTSVQHIVGSVQGMLNPTPVAAVDSTQTILVNIRALGQLVTTSVQLAKADINVSVRQGVLDSSSFTVSHVAQGAVEAGIDLSGLTEADVRYDALTDSYTITLPPAQLTSCRVDYIRQYGYSGTILPVDRDAARLLAHHVALLAFRDDALEGGILQTAEQQARLVFGNVVRVLTGSDAEIVFSGERGPLPASCQPEPPPGWQYDAATGSWTQQ